MKLVVLKIKSYFQRERYFLNQIGNYYQDGLNGGADKILYMSCCQEVVRVLTGEAEKGG